MSVNMLLYWMYVIQLNAPQRHAWQNKSTSLVSSSLGPSMSMNSFHWCLVTPQIFAGIGRFGLVCLPSWVHGLLSTGWEPEEGTSSQLSSWLLNIQLTITIKMSRFLHYRLQQDAELQHVVVLHIDFGSELPLTLFDVTHSCLESVKVGMFRQLIPHLNVRERLNERDSLRPWSLIKLKTCSVIQIWTFCIIINLVNT